MSWSGVQEYQLQTIYVQFMPVAFEDISRQYLEALAKANQSKPAAHKRNIDAADTPIEFLEQKHSNLL